MKRDKLQNDLENALRNAKAADILGRYDVASWWESQAQEIAEELKKAKKERFNG